MAAWRDGNAFECGPQGPPLSTSSHQHRAAAVRVDVSTAHLVRLPIAVGSRGATRVAASRKSRERARQNPSRSPTRRPAPTGICCSDEQMRAEVYV